MGYDPNIGRFAQRDPAEAGLNLYEYDGGNPLARVDPYGREWETTGDWKQQWPKGEKSQAVCKKCGKLGDLAWRITGKREDARVLLASVQAIAKGVNKPITIETDLPDGTVVDVTPILKLLDERLAAAIVNATNTFQGRFGRDMLAHDFELMGGFGKPDYFTRFFDKDEIMPAVDCQAAAYLILSKALLDTIAFTKRQPGMATARSFLYNPGIDDVKGLRKGDMAKFDNHPDYKKKHPNGAWRSEFVITTENGKTFWGHGGGALTYDEWKKLLRDAYNAGDGRQIQIGDVPGYDKNATMRFNIGELGSHILTFKYPSTQPAGR